MTVNASTDGEGEEPEDTGEVGLSTDTRSFGANASITGQVNNEGEVFIAADNTGTPCIYIGDTATGKKVKGFLSFDVSSIAGQNVLGAWLNIKGSRVGDPTSLFREMRISSTHYGNSLDGADYGVSSSTLTSFFPVSGSDFSFTNENLRNAVQNTLTADRQYFQVTLFIDSTSGNHTSDGLSISLSDVTLEVEYD